jgi:hypothetical protein
VGAWVVQVVLAPRFHAPIQGAELTSLRMSSSNGAEVSAGNLALVTSFRVAMSEVLKFQIRRQVAI